MEINQEFEGLFTWCQDFYRQKCHAIEGRSSAFIHPPIYMGKTMITEADPHMFYL